MGEARTRERLAVTVVMSHQLNVEENKRHSILIHAEHNTSHVSLYSLMSFEIVLVRLLFYHT